MDFSPGSLVKTRGREWVVLPDSTDTILKLKPLGGADIEVAGVHLDLEEVKPARFDLPTEQDLGDYIRANLLRDAVILNSRSSAGPFRCFGRIAVEPRPYQLVPLLMALRQDPVRILIADDIGVGKTIEACLIAREFLDRGEINRLAVLCPAQLAEQWQDELEQKFHIDAKLVLPSTARKLERNLQPGQSLFKVYPFVVVSMDYIKSDRHRNEFLRACPEMVIVDEAHTCSYATGTGRSKRHLRHRLVRELADDPERHMLFVTATPHSGKEEAFRRMLGFLRDDFSDLPEDLTGPQKEHLRREVAKYFIQRTRGDVKSYLKEETVFPDRFENEESYTLHPDYKKLFDRVLAYARETVKDQSDNALHKRVKWWSALALLRSLASSPAAAEATLRVRSNTIGAKDAKQVDELGRKTVTDEEAESGEDLEDTVPGSDYSELTDDEIAVRKRLQKLAREAQSLCGEKDNKLQKATAMVKQLLKDGFKPILFCRFIPTADYVAEELRKALPNDVTVEAITSILTPTDREARVAELGKAEKPVLVCTDCLSEGINLQEWFDAVIHYDLSWNPTRHEQRAGRVDRFSQGSPEVKILTYYGQDNQIDGIVLDVLIRKHRRIKEQWGISVPVPAQSSQVIEAVLEGLLLRGDAGGDQMILAGLEDYITPQQEEMDNEWRLASEREKLSRSMFAQMSIKTDEVRKELQEARKAAGTPQMVQSFVREALRLHGAHLADTHPLRVNVSEIPQPLKDMMSIHDDEIHLRFDQPMGDEAIYISRTSPVTEALATYVMDCAMDSKVEDSVAKRAGVIRTRNVSTRTTALLTRFRFQIVTETKEHTKTQLAEECRILAFEGSPESPHWLAEEQVDAILQSTPDTNTSRDQATQFLKQVTGNRGILQEHIESTSKNIAQKLLESHRSVRKASQIRNVKYSVEPKDSDILGIYIFLPEGMVF